MTTSKPTQQLLDLPMSSQPASPAKTSAWPEKAKDSMAVEASSSSTLPELFATWDHESSYWKTSQLSLLGGSEELSGSWPRSGMTVNGIAYQLPVLALRTYVTGSGLLPTPSAVDYGTNKGGSNPDGPERPSLQTMARQNRWPTPTSTDGRRSAESPEAIEARGANQGVTLNDAVAQLVTTPDANCWKGGNRRRQLTDPVYGITPDGGQLNPTWVEWLMGYPEGWTDLED